MLDARVGKRRLRTMNIQAEHPFVRRMFECRCVVEGIDTATQS